MRLPVVSDYKGNIFNKDAVLEWLLSPSKEEYSQELIKKFAHIKKLNDVIELQNLEEAYCKGEEDEDLIPIGLKCKFGDDLLGSSSLQYVYLIPCGDVLPRDALNLTKNSVCPVCQSNFENKNLIPLNPTFLDDEYKLQQRINELDLQHKFHNLKPKGSKKKRRRNEKQLGKIAKR